MSLATEIDKMKQKTKVVVKVGMLGDTQIGKTTLMVKYIENKYDEDYIETLGVNFMEKIIHLKNVDVTISVWDLGGQQEFAALMPLVCNDAKVMLFAFDLTARATLGSVKRWYKEARKENKMFLPFLIGTKFDLFEDQPDAYKQEITKQARKFARKMRAPLIYCSSAAGVNVKKIFKVIIARLFNLPAKIKESHNETNEAILEFNTDAPTDTAGGEEAAPQGEEKRRRKKGDKKRRKKKKDRGEDQ